MILYTHHSCSRALQISQPKPEKRQGPKAGRRRPRVPPGGSFNHSSILVKVTVWTIVAVVSATVFTMLKWRFW